MTTERIKSIRRLIKRGAKYLEYLPEILEGPSRYASIVNARNLIMLALTTKYKFTSTDIGLAFNRDHSTVLHSNREASLAISRSNSLFKKYTQLCNVMENEWVFSNRSPLQEALKDLGLISKRLNEIRQLFTSALVLEEPKDAPNQSY